MSKLMGRTWVGAVLMALAATAAQAMGGASEAVVLYDWAREKAADVPAGVKVIGTRYEVSFDSRRDGVWTEAGAVRSWRFSIRVPGASSVAVQFGFHAVPGAVLEVAGEYLTKSKARYVSAHAPGEVVDFALTAPVESGYPTVQVTSLRIGPQEQRAKDGDIEDEYVAYDCFATPERDLNARASLQMCVDGTGCCSGTLVNNSAGPGGAPLPYVLTAEHCQPGTDGSFEEPDLPPSAYRAQWKNAVACSASVPQRFVNAPGTVTQVGATHIAEWKGTGNGTVGRGDLWIIELDEWPEPEADAYMAGFDANDQAPTAGSTLYALHYGDVRPLQIASSPDWFFNDTSDHPEATNSIFLFTTTPESVGAITPGASGSGLFNAQGAMIGKARGRGEDGAGFDTIGSVWTRYGLGSFLAPVNTQSRTMGGVEAPHPPATPAIAIAVTPTPIDVGETAEVVWSVVDATDCTAAGAWAGERGLSGREAVSPAVGQHVFTLVCENSGRSASRSASLTVRETSSGGSGGGGSTGDWLLAVLILGTLMRRMVRRIEET
jgi:hypothetical protein